MGGLKLAQFVLFSWESVLKTFKYQYFAKVRRGSGLAMWPWRWDGPSLVVSRWMIQEVSR